MKYGGAETFGAAFTQSADKGRILCFLLSAHHSVDVLKKLDDEVGCEEEKAIPLLGCTSFAELFGNSTHAFGYFRDTHNHPSPGQRHELTFHVHIAI